MLHNLQIRKCFANGFLLGVRHVVIALALSLLLAASASAYTVVLLSGRTVEVPDSFTVTRSGVTYEHAPGIFVTIQMTSINVAATEQANNETPGSFLRRAEKPLEQQPPARAASEGRAARASSVSRRTLTDTDLRQSRARREQSVSAYERRRKELGLPTVEETQRQLEEEESRAGVELSEEYASQAQREAYWRERSGELRTAMAATDAEIDYLRTRIAETSDYYPTVTFTDIAGFAPFPVSPVVVGRIPRPRFPTVFPGTTLGPPGGWPQAGFTGRVRFGGGPTRGRISINGRGRSGSFHRRGFGGQGLGLFAPSYYGAPYSYDYTYERSELVTRLHELEAERAGLQARWRLLEDEARRAGVPPGWLRP